MTKTRVIATALVLLGAALLAGCGGDDSGGQAGENGSSELSGSINADGSSTVGPLTTAAAERFQRENSGVRIAVGISGTGGGFERFCAGETEISNASRPIKDEELQACRDAGIEPVEFRVATDALTVVASQANDFAECLTIEQLNAIWGPESAVDSWSDVPDADFPDQSMPLFGPGTDSGTFDYFTDEVNGAEGASRSDYQASEDDNVIVNGVAGSEGGLGYLGFTYYEENQDKLKAIAIDGGEGCVVPTVDAAQSGEYQPLARPLFIYVKEEALQRPEVEAFVRFYLENLSEIAQAAQYIPLSDERQQETLDKLEQAVGA